jgi:hypothetical protein
MDNINWKLIVECANNIRSVLNKKPNELKIGYSLSAGGILNAYREGDLSFKEASDKIELLIKPTDNRSDEIAWISDTFSLANKEQSAAHAMVVIKQRFDERIAKEARLRTDKLINDIEKAHHDAEKSTLRFKTVEGQKPSTDKHGDEIAFLEDIKNMSSGAFVELNYQQKLFDKIAVRIEQLRARQIDEIAFLQKMALNVTKVATGQKKLFDLSWEIHDRVMEICATSRKAMKKGGVT